MMENKSASSNANKFRQLLSLFLIILYSLLDANKFKENEFNTFLGNIQ
jgi:hypothetical protein